jgi:hypothetical protein
MSIMVLLGRARASLVRASSGFSPPARIISFSASILLSLVLVRAQCQRAQKQIGYR